jgi:hypothetical protein
MRLDEILSALREESANAEAPARVESNVMAAFRAQQQSKKRRNFAPWILAVAASLAVVAVVSWQRQPAPKVVEQKVAAVVAPAPAPNPPVITAAAVPPKKKVIRNKPKPVADPQAPLEAWSDFVPVPYAPPMNAQEGGQVLRVRLPRTTLQSYGFPMPADRAFDRLNAEVMVGQDGVVHAIRFAK